MTKYKYHPLVDSDTDGREKVPMFFSTDEKAVAKSHELYLAEIVLHYYRLHARTAHSKASPSYHAQNYDYSQHAWEISKTLDFKLQRLSKN